LLLASLIAAVLALAVSASTALAAAPASAGGKPLASATLHGRP
jgi:hypothetical protein